MIRSAEKPCSETCRGRVQAARTAPRRLRRPFGQRRTWLALIIGVLALSACTNSKFIIGVFYNRADNQALKAIAEWTDLDTSQFNEVRAYVGTFHTWHRKTQLPAYATWIRDITATVATADTATPEDFNGWFERLRGHINAIRECHPAHYAVQLGRTLSVEQVSKAENTWITRRAENRADDRDETRDERIERRVDGTASFLGKLGFTLRADQRDMIAATLRQQTSLREEGRALSDEWNAALFQILRENQTLEFDERLSSHVSSWFGQFERAYPDEWDERRRLWKSFAVDFEKTLSPRQRSYAVSWLNKLSRTLDAVALDRPDWRPADDPSYGCVVQTAGAAGGTAGADNTQSVTR